METALSIWTDQTRHDVQTWAENPSIQSLIVSLAARSHRETMTTGELLSSPELQELRSILGPVTQAKQQIGFVVFDRTGLQIAALLDQPVGKQTLVLRSFFVSRALDGEMLVSAPFIAGVDLPDSEGIMKPDQPTMFAASPVRNDSGDIVGALAFRFRPYLGFTRVLEAGRSVRPVKPMPSILRVFSFPKAASLHS